MPAIVLADPRVPDQDKVVWAALLLWGDGEDRPCSPSVGTVAKFLNRSKHSVLRSLQRLEKLQYLKVDRHGRAPGRAGRSSHYQLCIPVADVTPLIGIEGGRFCGIGIPVAEGGPVKREAVPDLNRGGATSTTAPVADVAPELEVGVREKELEDGVSSTNGQAEPLTTTGRLARERALAAASSDEDERLAARRHTEEHVAGRSDPECRYCGEDATMRSATRER